MFKHFFLLLILLPLLVSCADSFQMTMGKIAGISGCDATAVPFGAGSGTSLDPYQLCHRTHLTNMGVAPYNDKFFKLTKDLDLGGVATPLSPIGYVGSVVFNGTFDGNGHEISNHYFHDNSQTGVGLFWKIEDATVSNLNLAQVDLESQENAGGLAGYCKNTSISDMDLSGDVTAVNYAGLLCGLFEGTAAVSNITGSGTVSGDSLIGGLIGYVESGDVDDVVLTGMTINGTGCSTGGLLGQSDAVTAGVISNISVTGDVSGHCSVGGIVGSSNADIESVQFNGNVTLTGQQGGGVVGLMGSGSITNVQVIGDVSAVGSLIGGIVGYHNSTEDILRARYSGDVSGAGNIGGIAGYVTSAIMISNISSSGSVSGSDSGGVAVGVGGIVGYGWAGPALMEDVFSDATVSIDGTATGGGGIIGQDGGAVAISRGVFAGGLVDVPSLGGLTPLGYLQIAPVDTYCVDSFPYWDLWGNGVDILVLNDASNAIYNNFNFTTIWDNTTGTHPKLQALSF